MAKEKTDEQVPAPAAEEQQQPQQEQQRVQVAVDDSEMEPSYANFCRVTGTPEELILDFALNPNPLGVPPQSIKITKRIVTNFYTAKRMAHALQLMLQRHEQAFGVLETDMQKRVVGRATASPTPQTK